jgi:hypothetical protein
VSAIEWCAVLVDDFGFQHSEIMRMPWVTFLAYQRLATVRRVNKRTRDQFSRRDLRG